MLSKNFEKLDDSVKRRYLEKIADVGVDPVTRPLSVASPKHHALVKCSASFSNASLFVAFPSNKCLLSACVVMRSLTSACSRRSRFTVVETSTKELFRVVHATFFTGNVHRQKKASNKQQFLPTTFK